MSSSKNVSTLWASLLLVSATSVQASAETESIVVTANRAATQISEIPGTVLIVDGPELQQQVNAGIDLKDALAQLIPSLDIGSQGRTNYGQQMRGRSVLVMLDGVSLNSSRGISRQFESIDPFNIERIEVISGASAIYGGGGSGGIINIITKSAAVDGPRFEAQVGGKSGFNSSDDGDGKIAAAIQGANEQGDYRVSLAYSQTQAAYNANGDAILPDITQTSSQYGKQLDVFAKGGLNLTDNQRLDASLQIFENKQDSDSGAYFGDNFAGFSDPSAIAIKKGLVLSDQPETSRTQFNLKYAHTDFIGQQLYLQGYYRDEEMQFYPFPRFDSADPAASTISASNQRTQLIGIKGVLVSQLPRFNTELVYGFDADRETFESDQQYYDFATAAQSGGLVYRPIFQTGRYPGVEVDQLAAFLQAKVNPISALTLNAGVRLQYSKAKVDDFVATTQQYQIAMGSYSQADAVPGGSADYTESLFNLGAVYRFSSPHQLYANFAQGFDVPDPAKYYGVGKYDQGGQGPNLQQGISVATQKASGIKTNSYELGWRYAGEDLQTQVAAYYSISDKRIKNSSRTLTVELADEKKRIYGIDASAQYFINDAWLVGANGHLVQSRVKTNDDWRKLETYYASPSKLSSFVAWHQDDLDVRLQGMKIFDYSDSGERDLNGYFTADLLGAYRLPVGQLQFGVNNLFNEDYETLWSQKAQQLYARLTDPAVVTFQGRGRTYSVSYSVDF